MDKQRESNSKSINYTCSNWNDREVVFKFIFTYFYVPRDVACNKESGNERGQNPKWAIKVWPRVEFTVESWIKRMQRINNSPSDFFRRDIKIRHQMLQWKQRAPFHKSFWVIWPNPLFTCRPIPIRTLSLNIKFPLNRFLSDFSKHYDIVFFASSDWIFWSWELRVLEILELNLNTFKAQWVICISYIVCLDDLIIIIIKSFNHVAQISI